MSTESTTRRYGTAQHETGRIRVQLGSAGIFGISERRSVLMIDNSITRKKLLWCVLISLVSRLWFSGYVGDAIPLNESLVLFWLQCVCCNL